MPLRKNGRRNGFVQRLPRRFNECTFGFLSGAQSTYQQCYDK